MSIRRWLGSIVGTDGTPAPVSSGVVIRTPPAAIWAVGDVHGCLDLYRDIEQQIVLDGARLAGPKLIVVLGDMIDRGPDSAGMLDHVMASPPPGFERICLMGNHEDMLLRFMDDPVSGHAWLQHGGAATLASFGVRRDAERGYVMPPRKLRRLAQEKLAPRYVDFLRNLPLCLTVGNYFLSHAGVNPERRFGAQTRSDLIWSRYYAEGSATERPPGLDGVRVVHGHLPTDRVDLTGWRINVDTGACETGRLSAVRLSDNGPVRLLTARANARFGQQKASPASLRLLGTRPAVS